jgi:hypothetical protein
VLCNLRDLRPWISDMIPYSICGNCGRPYRTSKKCTCVSHAGHILYEGAISYPKWWYKPFDWFYDLVWPWGSTPMDRFLNWIGSRQV